METLAQSLLILDDGESGTDCAQGAREGASTVKRVFEYLDYRQYLADALEEKRQHGLSLRAVSLRAGFKSPNYLKLVISGKRGLTPASVTKCADFFHLRGAEREFFENLVNLNQAESPREQEHYYERLKASRAYVALKHVEHDQHEYFSKWYYAAIRELVLLPGFKNDPDWIARTLTPNIPIKAARETMELLFRLNLIRRGPGGKIEQTDALIGTPPKIAAAAAWTFHREMLDRSRESLDLARPADRDVTALTVAVSRGQYERARRKIHEFRQKLHAEFAERPQEAETVYQLNIQFFPLSEVRHEK